MNFTVRTVLLASSNDKVVDSRRWHSYVYCF